MAENEKPQKYQRYPADWPSWKVQLGIYPPVPPQGDGGDDHDEEGESGGQGNEDDLEPDEQDFEDEPEDDDFEPDDEAEDEEPEEGDNEDGDDGVGEEEQQFQLAPRPVYQQQLEPLDNRTFESWWDFIQSATDESLVGWHGRRSSRSVDTAGDIYEKRKKDKGEMTWHGTDTWEETLDLVRKGWPEGRKLLEDSIAIVRPKPEPFRSIEMSVAGAFPMVPNYAAGDPECMVIDPGSDMRASKPIVRIDFNHWTHAGVTPKDMMLRGAAVVSLAETLERHGYSTELRVIGNSRAGQTDFRYSIVFKRAGEYMDLDRAAFAIAHPACMRRLAFAILEQHQAAERDYSSGYGYPLHQPNDPTSGQPGGAIYISASQGGETVEKARAAVQKAADPVLKEIQLSEESGSNDD